MDNPWYGQRDWFSAVWDFIKEHWFITVVLPLAAWLGHSNYFAAQNFRAFFSDNSVALAYGTVFFIVVGFLFYICILLEDIRDELRAGQKQKEILEHIASVNEYVGRLVHYTKTLMPEDVQKKVDVRIQHVDAMGLSDEEMENLTSKNTQ